jgi:hypothetical protein
MCASGGASKRAAADQRAAETARQAQIESGRQQVDRAFAGFDDSFFDGRRQAFVDNAAPQLDRQFRDARENLIYTLADAGTLRSSVAGNRLADLERSYGENKLMLADQARGYAQQARADVEAARGGVIQNLFAAGDAALAGQQATGQAQMLAAQPTFSPIAQAFQNVGAGIGAARAGQQSAAIRGGGQTTSFGGGTKGSGRVVN